MFSLMLNVTRIGHPMLGIILPALILLISFVVTWMLIRYFDRTENGGGKQEIGK